MVSRPKISVLGIGNVGAQIAQWCAVRELGDLVLWNRMPDTVPHPALGRSLDLMEGGPAGDYWVDIKGSANLRDTAYSDVIVISAGVARKPGMSREELAGINAKIVSDLMHQTFAYSRRAVYIVVTNPVDAMTYVALKSSKVPRERVIGLAGALDSSRFAAFIARATGAHPSKIKNAVVIGEHGDGMIPMSRLAKVAGKSLFRTLPKAKREEIETHTKDAGEEIVRMLHTSASIAAGAACASMIESIVKGKNKTFPCSVLLEGEYGLNDVCLGVPVVLGKGGIRRIVELKLAKDEKTKLSLAAKKVRHTIDVAMAPAAKAE